MLSDLARRRSLLIAALVALRVKLEMMHRWLDNWDGVGFMAMGMDPRSRIR